MHEVGITQEIVAIAEEHARGAKVVRVVVEIGRLSAVLPDAVRFCFEACAEGTTVAGAALEIVEPLARARCRACLLERLFDRPFGLCACGGTDFEWLTGDELRVRSVEVE